MFVFCVTSEDHDASVLIPLIKRAAHMFMKVNVYKNDDSVMHIYMLLQSGRGHALFILLIKHIGDSPSSM